MKHFSFQQYGFFRNILNLLFLVEILKKSNDEISTKTSYASLLRHGFNIIQIVYLIYILFNILETCFPFLIHCWPIRARDVSHFKITKQIEKV